MVKNLQPHSGFDDSLNNLHKLNSFIAEKPRVEFMQQSVNALTGNEVYVWDLKFYWLNNLVALFVHCEYFKELLRSHNEEVNILDRLTSNVSQTPFIEAISDEAPSGSRWM